MAAKYKFVDNGITYDMTDLYVQRDWFNVGGVYSVGVQSYGVLGHGDSTNRSTLVQIGSLTNWRSISTADNVAAAIRTDGTLWTWGYNGYGALGLSDSTNRSSPVQVGTLVTWNQVATGGSNTRATKTDGTLWSWGTNNLGQLGLGDTTHRSSPVQVGALTNWNKIATGYYHSAATKTDGSLWTWGDNYKGQLGLATTSIEVPARLSSPVQVGSLTDWNSVACGYKYTTAVKSDGSLWTWGENTYGQLGLNGTITFGSPGRLSSPVQIGALTTWANCGVGERHTNAIKTDGTLWGWGTNTFGQLGLGDIAYRSSPVRIGALTNWSTLTSGPQYTFATKTDGTLWAWGDNSSGQLGVVEPTTVPYKLPTSSPVQIGALTDWASTSSNTGPTLALKTDGTLWAWGYNYNGQLGIGTGGTGTDTSSPVQVGSLTNWSKISSSGAHSAAIKTDGTLWTWGSNGFGRLGVGDSISRSSPVQVGALTDWLSVSAGGNQQIMAIKTDGTLWSWGGNNNGQLGLGDRTNRSSPVQVGALTNWSKVSSYSLHHAAIRTDGTLWTWGQNTYGILGLGDQLSRSSPVQVGSLTDWADVEINNNNVAAIKTDGTLWMWGANFNGQLAVGDYVSRSSPVQVGALNNWSKIYANMNSIIALKTDGTYWGWGANSAGELALGDSIARSSPVQVGTLSTWSKLACGNGISTAIKPDGTLWGWGFNELGELDQADLSYYIPLANTSSPVQVGALTNWSKIYASPNGASTFAIPSGGTLWAWGFNTSGQLGLGDRTIRSSPVQVGALTDWSTIACFGSSTAAIKTDGTLWMWGDNYYGQLGLDDRVSRSSPVQVGALTDWSKVSTGSFHAAAVKTNGTLWAWGRNQAGQLGLGDTAHRSSPVQVGSLTNWDKISCGWSNIIATKTDNTLWSCGYGDAYGELGLGDRTNRSSPVQVGALTNWSQLYSNYAHKIAIKTDGTLHGWGDNAYGQLGIQMLYPIGDLASQSSPVQVGALTNWSRVSCGYAHTVAVKQDGTLWTWGRNYMGQLGHGDSEVDRSSPVQVGALTDWKIPTAGYWTVHAIKTDGTLWGWGENWGGQLGIGDYITSKSSPVQVGSLTSWKQIAAGYRTMFALQTTRSTL